MRRSYVIFYKYRYLIFSLFIFFPPLTPSTMILTNLQSLFQYLYALPNKLGYVALSILSYTFILDWVKISSEFRNTVHAEAVSCHHLYKSNQCGTPIPAVVKQCVEWYTCAHTQNISGTLIWAEIIKRFLNSLLALDSHAMILITVNVFIVLILLVDRGFFRHLLDISKDIIRFLLMCITCIGAIWVLSSLYK